MHSAVNEKNVCIRFNRSTHTGWPTTMLINFIDLKHQPTTTTFYSVHCILLRVVSFNVDKVDIKLPACCSDNCGIRDMSSACSTSKLIITLILEKSVVHFKEMNIQLSVLYK